MNRKDSNRGFSLIELVVTIAIMAVVTAIAVGAYSGIASHRLKESAENTNTAISKLRSDTLTKSGSYELEISQKDDKYIAKITHTKTDGTVEVSYNKTITGYAKLKVLDKSGNSYTISPQQKLVIAFSKADGSVSKLMMEKSSGNVDLTSNSSIEIQSDYSSRTKNVKLIKLTGKHSVE